MVAQLPVPAPVLDLLGSKSISSMGLTSVPRSLAGGAVGSGGFPAANRAVLIPVRITRQITLTHLTLGAGATAAGNFDVGIYDSQYHLIIATGATAKGASVEHVIAIAETTIGPGLYYLAVSADGTNNYWRQVPNLNFCKLYGMRQMETAYPLPTTITPATISSAFLPSIGAYIKTISSHAIQYRFLPANVITPFHPEAYGSVSPNASAVVLTDCASAVMVDEQVYYYPFTVYEPVIAVKMTLFNGATAAGSIDIGIYDSSGHKLVSSGNTLQVGTNALQEFDITDTILYPGGYYMAVKTTDGTSTAFQASGADEAILPSVPLLVEVTGAGGTLPATATFGLSTSTTPVMIAMGIHFDALV